MRWPLRGRRRPQPVVQPTQFPPPSQPPRPAGGGQPSSAPTRAYQAPAPQASGPGSYPSVGRSPAPPAPATSVPPPPTPPAAAPPAPSRAAPPAGAPAAPPPPAGDDDGPVTRDDVRNLRRWLVVAGVWAVAATAIGVLAFLAANDNDAQQVSDSANQARRVERRLNAQVDQLESRLGAVPKASAVQSLGKQVRALQKVVLRQDKQLGSVGNQLKQIRSRLDAVEKTADDALQKAGNTTTTP